MSLCGIGFKPDLLVPVSPWFVSFPIPTIIDNGAINVIGNFPKFF